MIRNILDSIGNVIGSLTLPEDTSEAQVSAILAIYSTINPPSNPLTLLSTYSTSATNQVTTSSGTASTVGSMTFTPTQGTYLAFFSGTISTGGASAQGEFGIYVDGVQASETRRDISCSLQLLGGLVTISLNTIGVGTYTGTRIDLNGSQVVDVRFKSNNGGTIGFGERTFILIKVK